VPLHEFACRKCGHRFEELVGSHVGIEEADLRCPECGAEDLERLISSYATLPHSLTPNQKRRSEDSRGTDRGGAMERFKKQRATEKRRSGGRGHRG
jgi:putative FmdB family regulatory protein